jgi:predicted O-linked N-acetylglucosamine transferase (SPINDLY family)
VTYVGYAATTGLGTMGYRVTDPHMEPPDSPSDGPEALLRLPTCYWAYRPAEAGRTMPVGDPPVRRNGFVTFGSFNNFSKVNGHVIDAWARILGGVPGSRLLVVVRGGEENAHLVQAFESRGVGRDRVRLLPRQSSEAYFRLHNEVDVSLDPFPYNGGITGLDSAWMGVPFVTLAGDRAVGRAGLSILTNLGLGELVSRGVDDYVRRTVELARDEDRLARLRASLRERCKGSPLMNEVGFVRAFETLLATAWEAWRVSGG